MSWPEATEKLVHRLDAIRQTLEARFVARTEAVRLLLLAAVCREHLLLLGPPGTAKTELITRFAELIDARHFRYLLTRFTEPAEIFGPLDFQRFRAGEYHVRTSGMLPEANVVFLDEVFHGSSAILNTLLTVLNERRFDNGSQTTVTPLVSLFGAAAELPDDPALAAFADRFLLRLRVAPVARLRLPELLDRGWTQEQEALAGRHRAEQAVLRIAELEQLTPQLRHVELGRVRGPYGEIIAELAAQGVVLSDRRIVRGQKLIAGAALLRLAEVADVPDLWPLRYLWAGSEDARVLEEVLDERLGSEVVAEPKVRSALSLVELARQRVGRLEAAAGDNSILSTLYSLNTDVLQVLQRHHPGEHDTIDEVRRLIAGVTQRLNGRG
ncbi:AAA family ATPase [Amycolatopsis balhimycina DSM 5908]|uniref:AAA family ATPase n=1 Tax=Amycolatopsis balhimycina DSM 5908 TaxID=1081091 RepID=A0A428WI06_AMYBA|nr:AAA family ATPase [Amycolatopsis balhimycina]RSM42725.1 AAA family ATPase [Amycolatopsis balhimycina DSM 5908]